MSETEAPVEVEHESEMLAQEEPGPIQGRAAPPSALLSALFAVQAELPTLPKDKVNPHFGSRFTGLETMVETVGPILNRHDLLWTTLPGYDTEGRSVLHYQLSHVATGEALTGTMRLLLGKEEMQGLGSAITYGRRYALSAVLNLVADEDDDGNASSDDARSGGAENGGDTVNLQNDAKGLRNEAINTAFSKVGLPAQDKPWGPLGRVPADRADALREALEQQQAMA